MLRLLVLALALANAGYFVWTRGWLDGVVGVPHSGSQHEPERLARQVRPETVKVLPPATGSAAAPLAAAAAASVAASGSTAGSAAAAALACLEAGPFDPAEVAAATAAVQAALPPGSWADVKVASPGSWLVYMGRYGEPEMLAKKKDEIARMKLPFEEVRSPPALAPGLALGRFDDQAGAERLLAQLATRGIKSARVVESGAPSRHLLRVDGADAGLQKQLAELKAEALGSGFAPCVKVAAN